MNIGWPGKVHDVRVFVNSSFYQLQNPVKFVHLPSPFLYFSTKLLCLLSLKRGEVALRQR